MPSSSYKTGLSGAHVAKASSVSFFPIALLLGVLARVRQEQVHVLLVATHWPAHIGVSDLMTLLNCTPWEIPVWIDLLSQTQEVIIYPPPEIWNLCVWA